MEKLLIIGSGCAGLTAGIYGARSNAAPLILSGLTPGGQLMLTTEVENFPGFENPVMAPDLMEAMRKQAKRLGVRFIDERVDKVDFSLKSGGFKVWTSEGREVEASCVIVATGANAKWLGIESEKRLMGKGVSACATCDGFFFKGKRIVVVGGGDTAFEEATFLTNFASQVTLIHRREGFRASAAMLEKARKNPKIAFVLNVTVDEVLGKDSVEGVMLKNVKTGEQQRLECNGFFVAIGHEPVTGFLKGHVELDDIGYIRPKAGAVVETSVPGVFAAGDCVDRRYRQAVTAAGLGCMAAIEARTYLEHKQLIN